MSSTWIESAFTRDALKHISAVSAMIGYCDLPVGTVITKEWVERLHEHYIPKLEESSKAVIGTGEKYV